MKKSEFIKNTVKLARKRRRVTQKGLAHVLGVSRQTIHALESGNYSPSLGLALRISQYFHEPIENLFSLGPE